MKKTRGLTERNSRMLLAVFLGILLVTLGSVSVGSSALIRGIIYSNATEILEEFGYYFESELNSGVRLSVLAYNDMLFQELASYDLKDSAAIRRNMTQLQNYAITNKEIASLYVYNGVQGKLYLSTGIPGNDNLIVPLQQLSDRAVIDYIQRYWEYPVYTPIPRTAVFADGSEKFYYTVIGYNPYINISNDGKLNSAMIVNLSINWVNRMTSNNSVDGKFLIMDDQNRAISSNSGFEMYEDLSRYRFVQEADAQYLIEEVDGTAYFITGTQPNEYGWRYYWFLPYSIVTARISSLWILCGALGVVLTLISFIVIRRLSRSINDPILHIQEDLAIAQSHLSRIEIDKQARKDQNRQDFLNRLLSGEIMLDKASIKEKFQELSVDFPLDGASRVLLLRVANHREFISMLNPDERAALFSAMMDAVQQATRQVYYVECFHPAYSCQIVVLISPKPQAHVNQESTLGCAESLRLLGEKLLMRRMYCSISDSANSLDELPQRYNEALETDNYHLFQPKATSLFYLDVVRRGDIAVYPEATEHRMMDALSKGDFILARKHYLLFVDTILPFSYQCINIAFARLTLAINILLSKQKGGASNAMDAPKTFGFSLDHVQSMEEVNECFFSIMHAIADAISQTFCDRNEALIHQINSLIGRDFSRADFCIESIASDIGISADYVSRLFRQQTGETILTRIIKTRIDFACAKLTKTDESIADISAAAGYSNVSYFYRSFKKETGVTPTEYRAGSCNKGIPRSNVHS